MPPDTEYSLQELADLAGATPRTIRYYVAQGLLASPGRVGPGTTYTEGHLNRLRLIRRLQREHLPLAEIRSRLAALDDATVAALVEAPAAEPPTGSAIDYIRGVLGGDSPTAGTLWNQAGGGSSPVSPAGPPASPTPSPVSPAGPPASPTPSPVSPAGPPASPASAPRVSVAQDLPESALAGPSPTYPATPTPDRSQWDRINLAPDVELHVRRPLARRQNKQVERLITIARELFEEDQP